MSRILSIWFLLLCSICHAGDTVDLQDFVSVWLKEDNSLDRIYGINRISKNLVNPVDPVKIYSLADLGTSTDKKIHSETIRDDNGNIIAQIVYDTQDRVSLFTLYPDAGGKVVVSSSYDKAGVLVSNTFLTYDDAGNLVRREVILATESTESTELVIPAEAGIQMLMVPVSPQSSYEQFTYDHLGNRYQYLDKEGYTTTITHNAVNQYQHLQRPLAFGLEENIYPQYDDNGNLEDNGRGCTYEYDYRNRLKRIKQGTTTIAEYTYDALGRRIAKTAGGTRTLFYYDTGNEVIAEYEDTDTEPARAFVYGNGLDEVLCMFLPEYEGNPADWQAFLEFCTAWLSVTGNGNFNAAYDHNNSGRIDLADFAYFASIWDVPSFTETHYYYLHDALGSVRGLIGGKFNREEDREFYNYDAYGKLPDDSASSTIGNPFLFAGYRYDTETKLYFLRARTYDPSTGRFIQFDPIGYADSMSLYEYVGSDPMNYTDPYGLFERNTDSWWKEGLSWSNPLGYFSPENAARRQQLRQLQLYYEAKYQAAENEAKLRGVDEKWKGYCCCAAKDACKGVVVGIGQGTANTVNGLQDSVIGVVNLPASVCNLLGADVYEIPSPDWSSGLLMTEDPLQHQISKFVGGESSYFLITVGAGSLAKALKNCKKPANALCEDLTGIADDLLKPADEVVDLSKGAKPKKLNNVETIPKEELKNPPTKRGNAPTGKDGKPVEIHHKGQKPDSPMKEMTQTEHRGGENFQKNHPNTGQKPSEIDRKEFDKLKKNYWKEQWDKGRFNDIPNESK